MIPQVGRYLINFWRDGKAIASLKVDAPTKHLAWLALVFDHPHMLKHKFQSDKITVTRMRTIAARD